MTTRETYFSVKPFFAHAVAVTTSVTVLPVLLVLAAGRLFSTLSPIWIATFGIVFSLGAMALGTALWNKRIESTEISFSDLMLWRWYVRRRAEDTLDEGARLLGLDRSGQPVDDIRILPDQQLQVLKDLTSALESKDPYTHGHSQRVERHVYRTAAVMHLSIQDIEDLRKAAALHDVGKIRVPDRILRKPNQLTIEERVLMEEHSVVGAWMVSSVANADVISAVRHHHERWDGAGYPDGLAGGAIPLYARIIAVADAYDAVTSTRPYRSSAGREDAVAVLRNGAGTQFDPDVVEAFIAGLPARLPITAGFFLILGGVPQRVLREFASWLKRLGAGSLAPAVGAAGAAVVLGASSFSPHAPAPKPVAQQPPVVVETTEEAPDVSVDPLPKSPAKTASKPAPRPRLIKDRDDGTIVLAAEMSRDVEEPEMLTRPSEPESEPEPQPEPTVEPRAEPSNVPDDDEGSNEPTPTPSPTGRNKNDGRDGCSDGNAGKGNDPANCGGGSPGSAAREENPGNSKFGKSNGKGPKDKSKK